MRVYCFGCDAFFSMFFMDTQPIDIVGLEFFSFNVAIKRSRGHGRKELIIGEVHGNEAMVLFAEICENRDGRRVVSFDFVAQVMIRD